MAVEAPGQHLAGAGQRHAVLAACPDGRDLGTRPGRLTMTGVSLLASVPSPSWPKSLLPQASTWPVLVSASELSQLGPDRGDGGAHLEHHIDQDREQARGGACRRRVGPRRCRPRRGQYCRRAAEASCRRLGVPARCQPGQPRRLPPWTAPGRPAWPSSPFRPAASRLAAGRIAQLDPADTGCGVISCSSGISAGIDCSLGLAARPRWGPGLLLEHRRQRGPWRNIGRCLLPRRPRQTALARQPGRPARRLAAPRRGPPQPAQPGAQYAKGDPERGELCGKGRSGCRARCWQSAAAC